MLLDFERDPGAPMQKVFFEPFYRGIRQRLSRSLFGAMWQHVDDRFTEQAPGVKPLITVSWEPGSDWTGTVFESIYPACHRSFADSAKFLGLLYMDVAIRRSDVWGFHHCDIRRPDGTISPIRGRTYYLLRGFATANRSPRKA